MVNITATKAVQKFNIKFMNEAQKIAKILLDIKAVNLRTNPPFTWNTGLMAPTYCDNRQILSYPRAREKVIKGFLKLIKAHKLKFDVIAGTATAGIPWAAFIAQKLKKPLVYVRAQPKDYALARQVEGTMPALSRVLVIEDLISTGRSSMATITACQKEYQAKIVAVVAIFSYEMDKATAVFQQSGVPLFTQCGLSTLINYAVATKYINEKQKTIISSWSADPENWVTSLSNNKF